MLIFRRSCARTFSAFCCGALFLTGAPGDASRAQAPVQSAMGAMPSGAVPSNVMPSGAVPGVFGDEETPPTREAPSPALLASLRSRLETSEERAATGGGVADAQNLALWRFKLEQARLWMDDLDRGLAFNPRGAARQMGLILDRAEAIARAHGDAVYPVASQMHERAYLAQNDGSSQPFWVFLPRGYSSRRKYPLVIFLHGYDPSITKAQPYLPGEKTWSLATARNFIFAVPYGRRNSDFLGVGEDDTLAVLREIQTHYSVDTSRTFLAGASMGGYGTLAIGLHRPDLWAGMAPMAARSDIYLWLRLDREQIARETPWKTALHEADDPRSLVKNAAHLPIFLQHGALDPIVDVTHSRLFTSDLRALNYAVRYREITNGDHYIYWQASSYEMALDWLSALRPPGTTRPTPYRVLYTSYDLRDNGAYWASIDAFQTYGKAARVDIEIKPDNLIEATTENVARLELSPPPSFFTPNAPLTLRVNGQVFPTAFDKENRIRWTAPNPNESNPAASTEIQNEANAATPDTTIRDHAASPDAGPLNRAPLQTAPPMSTHVAPIAAKTTAGNAAPTAIAPTAIAPTAVAPTATGANSAHDVLAATIAASSGEAQVAFPGIKTPRRSGPLRDCYRDPFLLVYGTRDIKGANLAGPNATSSRLFDSKSLDAAAAKVSNAKIASVIGNDEANARRFAHEWSLFVDGIPPVKADREVTLADRRRFNLILFGTRESNSILAEFADRLPVELMPDGYRLNAERHGGKNLGLVLCYPSPFDERRMVVVQSGLFWGSALAINHKFDLQPDYIVFDSQFDISDGTNRALAAGYFDNSWQIQIPASLPGAVVSDGQSLGDSIPENPNASETSPHVATPTAHGRP